MFLPTDYDDEGESEYRAGGYHPVKIGELLNNQYATFLIYIRSFLPKFQVFGDEEAGVGAFQHGLVLQRLV